MQVVAGRGVVFRGDIAVGVECSRPDVGRVTQLLRHHGVGFVGLFRRIDGRVAGGDFGFENGRASPQVPLAKKRVEFILKLEVIEMLDIQYLRDSVGPHHIGRLLVLRHGVCFWSGIGSPAAPVVLSTTAVFRGNTVAQQATLLGCRQHRHIGNPANFANPYRAHASPALLCLRGQPFAGCGDAPPQRHFCHKVGAVRRIVGHIGVDGQHIEGVPGSRVGIEHFIEKE